MRRRAVAWSSIVVASCHSSGAPAPASTPQVLMRFDRAASFYSAPFPSDDLLKPDGTVAIDGFPNGTAADIVAQAKALVGRDARGFSVTGGVFFALTGPIDPARLPDVAGSVAPGASAFLVGVDDAAPDFGARYPTYVSFVADGGPFGAANLLSLVPIQGTPLRSRTTYAAVVLRASGADASNEMARIAAGQRPDTMPPPAFDRYTRALAALAKQGIDARDVAGLAVFTTDDPTAAFASVRSDILSRPAPKVDAPFTRTDLFDTYCVYQTTIGMPDYQAGTPPFTSPAEGGEWTFDAGGKPIVQRTETANVVVTIPRAPMPAGGYPVAVFIRTGGPGQRPIIDGGPRAVTDGPAIGPGLGPALHFAAAGFAGVSVDGPHGGLRNVTHADEQFLMFNIANGGALRDNVRQSAVEIVLLAHVLESLSIAASDCPGAGATHVSFDMSRVALMGHSMGATIAPLTLAFEPRYKAAILSGAGGSWIENIVYKEKPVAVRPVLELMLGYTSDRRALTVGDPALTMIQWAIEPADPLVFTRRVLREPAPGESPRHVLMEQGIVDHYILPRIANATSLSLGLDLAGVELDQGVAELDALDQTPLSKVLAYSGRSAIALPASGNFGGATTAIVVQHPADTIEDGHEIVFQTDPPKHEYRCFLSSFAASVGGAGAPRVPQGTTPGAPCP